jgi:phosphoenolpyruvate carboxykinase (ATP)
MACVRTHGISPSSFGLDQHGLTEVGDAYWNLTPDELYEHAVRQGEGKLADNGALVCYTGAHTGRSPQDKFFVDEPGSSRRLWWGQVNRPISGEHFDRLLGDVIHHCRGRKLYVRDMFAGADDNHRVPIRIITETAWHNLFAGQLFVRPPAGSTGDHRPAFTVINVPTCAADPKLHGTRSGSFIVAHLAKGLVLIGGTAYAGEIKKSIFTIMNYVLPLSGVLSMHCSANVGAPGDVALFFGLSGTGKTTLSADPQRRLIGDDEHGWSDRGVFNIEGGCYAKCINLSPEAEPQIFDAIRRGAVLENVVMDPAGRVDYASAEYTENTRAAYPLEHIANAVIPSVGGHPRNVIFLTCDAFGVLPPIARLSPDQAMYHFLSGYTAKVAGTEKGVTEPSATFSTCFGAPFLPLPPEKYATMLGEKLARHRAQCWLVNTGWTGGGCGVGQRIKLRYTRAMVKAALDGRLASARLSEDPVFGLAVPRSCPEVPPEVLLPRQTWPDPLAYDEKARHLAGLFVENFKTFAAASKAAAAAGPRTPAGVA